MPCLARMRIFNCAMTEDPEQQSNRLLEPAERISAVLSGLIMVLTFTCSFSVAGAGRTEVRTMLLAALGCNLAWGIIDGVFYLMGCFSKRGRNLVLMREVQKGSAVQGTRILASTMPRMLVPLLPEGALELMRQKITAMPPAPAGVRLTKEDLIGAASIALLIFLSTLPVVVPFLFFSEASQLRHALRISNFIAIAMMFLAGYSFGVHSGGRPWRTGISAVVFGAAMVGVAIPLGG